MSRSVPPGRWPRSPLEQLPPSVCGTLDQPLGWTDGRGAGLAWVRSAPPPGWPLTTSRYSNPRADHSRLAFAARLRDAPTWTIRTPRGVRVDVLVRLAL